MTTEASVREPPISPFGLGHSLTNGPAESLRAIPDTPAGRLHRAIAVTSLLTGRRCTQVLKLTPSDIDIRRGTWWYRVRGRRITYWCPLPQPARLAIMLALAARGPRPHGHRLEELPRDEPIFDISRQAHSSALRRYAQRAGLAFPLSTPIHLRVSGAKRGSQLSAQVGTSHEKESMRAELPIARTAR